MKQEIKMKGYPALCETGAELCDLLIRRQGAWHNVLVNDCLDSQTKPQLKAMYREGLRLYHRHIEQMLDFTAQLEAGLNWPLDTKHNSKT